MSTQSYLIDTNIVIGLEDNHAVKPSYAKFSKLAARHKIDVFVHEAARDDIKRDRNLVRRAISESKLEKFQILEKVRGLSNSDLSEEFGLLKKPNDEVDATLLHAISTGAADFLVTEDQGLHDRASQHSLELQNRVLFIEDATQLLAATFEPLAVPIRNVADVSAHTISLEDSFFDSLKDDYPEFNDWWREKCIGERRPCWVVYDDDELAGLIVRKDETAVDTDATQKLSKILKICTFKVAPGKRGIKLGELLLKMVLWYAHHNSYDLAYVTAYPNQDSLIALLEYYGFEITGTKGVDGELILEKIFSEEPLERQPGKSTYELARTNYPRFIADKDVRGFVIPIRGVYHDVLYPDIRDTAQQDLFLDWSFEDSLRRSGNTIPKVYISKAKSNLGGAGSLLFFYKSRSNAASSQSLTAIGVLENVSIAHSTRELVQMTGGRSVYTESQLREFEASPDNPHKVLNYLLVSYLSAPIPYDELVKKRILLGHPQSITELKDEKLSSVLSMCKLGFQT